MSPPEPLYRLPSIPHLRLRATLVAEEAAHLPPYKGSMLRGAFGHALRRTVCTLGPKQACRPCPLRKTCVYTRLFETFIEGEPPPFLKGTHTSPRPYVFEPVGEEATRRDFEPGDELTFDLLLFGRAVELQGFALVALERMAPGGLGSRRARFRLERVAHAVGDGANGTGGEPAFRVGFQVGYVRGERAWQPVAASPGPEPVEVDGGRLRLAFETPTRFKNNGRLTDRVRFRDLVFRALRRVLELAHFHVPGSEVDWEFRHVLEAASAVSITRQDLHWHDWERYSNRQETSMRFGGLVGEVELEGPLEDFAPLLAAAELVHVGKGTTFGLGQVWVGAGPRKGKRESMR